jgi:dynein light chain LC8-type
MAGTAAVVKVSAMAADQEQDCVDCAAEALNRFKEQRAIAQWMKKELDSKYGAVWHVIVGHSFGSYVSHDNMNFVYFFIGDVGFLVWRTKGAVSPGYAGPPHTHS